MKGAECGLAEYMQGANKRFIIPVYQRNYDWKLENCKQLYDDLVKVIKTNRKTHFFGSIVSVYEPSGKNIEFLVIDGQQRLTTVSLLLLAMYNLIQKGVIVPQDDMLATRIYEEFLVDKYQKQEISIDELFDAICRLEIISIRLENDDNPQLIFESLNSTGLDLSEGDKIRNFILMGLPSQQQELYYEKYWNRIEEHTGYDVSAFIRDYLSVKQQEIPAQKRIYRDFKEYVNSANIELEILLDELLKYAKRYAILLRGCPDNRTLDACIYRLNRLETTVTRPFFLEVLRLQDEKVLNIDDVTDIFLTTENYLLRRSICDLPTNVLNKVFLTLHHEIMRYDGTAANYIEKFKYALTSKKERARFPDDDEFAMLFSERQIYQMNSKNKVYILERLENDNTLEDKDVYRHVDAGDYSIEHIMPQHLTPTWIKALGADYEQIHEQWLHRIANLTLTAYNSKYSNSSFEEKKTMEHGFSQSGIRLNQDIAKKDKWTLVELEERDSALTQRALKIWVRPTTDYKPAEKQLDSYTLDDDAETFSGRLIAKFNYKNTEQPVGSWAEMYEKVLRILYAEDMSIIENLAGSSEEGVPYHFSTNKNAFIKSAEVGEGIYVLTNSSTQNKLSVLKRVFKLYNEDPNDLVFYLRDNNSQAEEEAGTRFEVRRKYWAFALEKIKEANIENHMFRNVTPAKGNWINGAFGIGSFYICCVANSDSSRVDLYMGKKDKHANKAAYDKLLANKSAIESVLGAALIWNRGDDVNSSKVSYQLNNVSIENETDWLQMANFQAQWSKKFYDVLVPYLR